MVPWQWALLAVVSTAGCFFLWFRDVWSIMRERKSTVESAARQWALFCRKAAKTRENRNAATVLRRCESIYGQAVDRYNTTLHKPWIYLPARLMGFRRAERRKGEPM